MDISKARSIGQLAYLCGCLALLAGSELPRELPRTPLVRSSARSRSRRSRTTMPLASVCAVFEEVGIIH
jgi:hypothetical protein